MSDLSRCGRGKSCRELDVGTDGWLRKLNEKAHSYIREMIFIWQDCVDWRGCITLFANTNLRRDAGT